ncbi:HAD-IA family hydrolase [Candidatus Daviesbacteria bacterium]|nr:HAD-IA family hydrolase [Candidatus Daviesbacteria bacterium]
MSKRKFDAVLFDIDGTILNTGEYIFQAYQYTMALHLKKEVTWEDVVPVLGLPFKECYRILTNLEEVDYLMETHHQYQVQNSQSVKAYENTLKTLRELKKAGVAIAAVTSHTGELLIRNLKIGGMDKFFKVIVTPMEVKNPKPDPESIFKALGELGIKPNKAVFIGDSPADIAAGKAARVKTVAALYGFHGEGLLKTRPDFVVDDIEEIIPIIL